MGDLHVPVRVGNGDGKPDETGEEIDLGVGHGIPAGDPGTGSSAEELPVFRRPVE